MLLYIHQPHIFSKEIYQKELNSNCQISQATVRALLDIKLHDEAFKIVCTYLQVFNPNYCFFVGFYARPLVTCYVYACNSLTISRHFESLMASTKFMNIEQTPGISVLIFELLLNRQFFSEQANTLVSRAIIFCLLGFKKINNTSLAWAQRYLVSLVPKYFPERKSIRLFWVAVSKTKAGFRTEVRRKLKKLDKSKLTAIREGIEKAMMRIYLCE